MIFQKSEYWHSHCINKNWFLFKMSSSRRSSAHSNSRATLLLWSSFVVVALLALMQLDTCEGAIRIQPHKMPGSKRHHHKTVKEWISQDPPQFNYLEDFDDNTPQGWSTKYHLPKCHSGPMAKKLVVMALTCGFGWSIDNPKILGCLGISTQVQFKMNLSR